MAIHEPRGIPRSTLENNRMRSTFLTLAGAFLLALPFAVGVQAQSAPQMGYVNMNVLISEIGQARGVESTLQQEQDRLQGDLDRLRGTIQRLMESFQQQRDRLDDDALARRAQEIQMRQQEYQEMAMAAEVRLSELQDEIFDPIINDIIQAVEAIRVEGGYAFIFDGSSMAFLAVDPALDLTSAVRSQIDRVASGEDR